MLAGTAAAESESNPACSFHVLLRTVCFRSAPSEYAEGQKCGRIDTHKSNCNLWFLPDEGQRATYLGTNSWFAMPRNFQDFVLDYER